LTSRLFAALEHPSRISTVDLALSEKLLCDARPSNEVYDRSLALLAAVVYWRPDLVRPETVACLGRLLSRAPLREAVRRHSVELLRFMLATPAAPHAVSLLINMLSRPGRFPLEYSVLLEGLGYAAFWAMPLLNFPDLVRLLDNPDLGGERERLLH